MRLFPDGPHEELLDKVDIVAVTTESMFSHPNPLNPTDRFTVLEATHGDLGELGYVRGKSPFRTAFLDAYTHTRTARKEALGAIMDRGSPSECVKDPAHIQKTLQDRHGPRYGRPSDRFGPPTALFSEPLALLKYRLDHLESLTPDPVTLDHAFNLVAISTGFFGGEKDREGALKPTLEALLPGRSDWQLKTVGNSAIPDAAWLEGPFTYLIFELKNEQGLGGDPFLQGLLTYGKVTARPTVCSLSLLYPTCPPLNRIIQYNSVRQLSNLPVILLTIAGNVLILSTAIFTNEMYADELLSIKLHFGPHGSDKVFHVARAFMAIQESMKQLRELYRNLQDAPRSPPPLTVAMWPRPTGNPPESTEQLPKLEFYAKVERASGKPLPCIDEENENHAMYLARMQIKTSTQTGASIHAEESTQAEAPIQTVFVKFAIKYNADAHRLLADRVPPLAPVLHFCAPIVGDMYMIVTEYIPGRSINLYSSTDGHLGLPQAVKRDASHALTLLHEKNWVFGDLRPPNILYLPDSDGGRVLLVDFDGVGVDGEGRYSACLNPAAGLCASVKRGGIMKKEHDWENLEQLLEWLRLKFSKSLCKT